MREVRENRALSTCACGELGGKLRSICAIRRANASSSGWLPSVLTTMVSAWPGMEPMPEAGGGPPPPPLNCSNIIVWPQRQHRNKRAGGMSCVPQVGHSTRWPEDGTGAGEAEEGGGIGADTVRGEGLVGVVLAAPKRYTAPSSSRRCLEREFPMVAEIQEQLFE